MNRRFGLLVVPAAVAVTMSVVAASLAGSARNASLTIFSHAMPVASIDTVGTRPSRTIWRCPHNIWCGEEVSFDWAPDGRRLALTLDEIGGTSGYAVGLHVVDIASGRDLQIPAGAPARTTDKRFPAYRRKIFERLGCAPPTDLAWAPDGSRLAYRCPSNGWQPSPAKDQINVLEIDGSGYRTIPTLTPAFWPSWSPDGKRIAYSSGPLPRSHPSLYTVALDGSTRRLLANDATAPTWSPDGKTIAYQSSCGVRFVTPRGKDVTPRPRSARCGIRPGGRPVWSPDGSTLAIETSTGIYELRADGSGLHLLSSRTSTSHYGQQPGRPSWRPLP